MQFLAVTKPRAWFATDGFPDDFAVIEARERIRARELYGDGSLRQV